MSTTDDPPLTDDERDTLESLRSYHDDEIAALADELLNSLGGAE